MRARQRAGDRREPGPDPDPALGHEEQAACRLAAAGETALAATADEGSASAGTEDAGFAAAEGAARLRAGREAIAARVHELALARVSAAQAAALAALFEARDRALAEAIRRLRDEVLPRWHLQVAEAVALRRAAEAAEALRTVGAGAAPGGGPGDRMVAMRRTALGAIEQGVAAAEAAIAARRPAG